MPAQTNLGPLAQIARVVGSVPVAAAWYRDVLGLAHLYTYGRLAFFDCGGTRLLLTEQEGPLPADSILYFRVQDINAAHALLIARGVAFLAPPRRLFTHPDRTEEWLAMFSDPDGRPLGILSEVHPNAAGS